MEQEIIEVVQPEESVDERTLEEAAKIWGVETDYWDIWGKQHHATPAVEKAILGSLGVETRNQQTFEQAIEERSWRDWSRPLPPTLVLDSSQTPHFVTVSLPESHANEEASFEVQFEQGKQEQFTVSFHSIAVEQQAMIRGQRFVRRRVLIPVELPLGYHNLKLKRANEHEVVTRLVVCPGRAYLPNSLESGRAAGVAISLYGVRSERNWGCGDTTDLKGVIDWAVDTAGVSFIALNPLHVIPNRQPYNTSPYLPDSVFYRNPLYLDVQRVEDFKSCPRALKLLKSPGVMRELAVLRAAPFVEYERVYRLKLRFLKLLFHKFLDEWRQNTPRAQQFAEYIRREGDLLNSYALYATLDESIRKEQPDAWNWRSWPEEYQAPASPMTQEFARRHWRGVLFHKYLQWQLDIQLAEAQEHSRQRGLSIGLYHDLALATDRFGGDLWAHREFFVSGCRVGSPPDAFSPKGQDWSFPPPNSERHYEDGYRLFAESIRQNCRHGGALRIDHVMRFFHLFWIPDGMEATEGTYVRDRHEDLLHILALESVRNKVLIVGEDLGTVPDEVRRTLHQFGILSYGLFYFARDRNGRFLEPQEYSRDALVSVTTHDLPTLAGYWVGRDIETRREAGQLTDEGAYHRMREERLGEKQRMLDLLAGLHLLPDWFPRNARDVPELTGELHNAIVGFLAATPSKLLLLNQEDLLKETEQQNLPGSTEQYPNWRRKMKCTVEELSTSGEVRAFTQMFRSWLERTGRLNVAGPGGPART